MQCSQCGKIKGQSPVLQWAPQENAAAAAPRRPQTLLGAIGWPSREKPGGAADSGQQGLWQRVHHDPRRLVSRHLLRRGIERRGIAHGLQQKGRRAAELVAQTAMP